MRRGFLLKAKGAAPARPNTTSIESPNTNSALGVLKIPFVPNLPSDGSDRNELPDRLSHYRITTLPLSCLQPAVCLLYLGVKDAVLAMPGFPAPYFPWLVGYRISNAPGAGKGMFATADIHPGDLILCERPMILFPVYFPRLPITPGQTFQEGAAVQQFETLVESLGPAYRREFFALSNCKPNYPSKISGIFATNALCAGPLPGSYKGQYAGIGREVSRINHRRVTHASQVARFVDVRYSCSPNADYTWNLMNLTFEIRAIRHIKEGEQIFIAYIPLMQPRATRQETLQSKYSFRCACSACSLPESEWSRSDARRQLLEAVATANRFDDDSSLIRWIADHTLPDNYIIQASMKIVTIMEEEGLTSFETCRTYYPRIVKSYCALKDRVNAQSWAKKLAKVLIAMTRDDGGWGKIAQFPEQTDWWGRRKRS
jgi:hypothetical protein